MGEQEYSELCRNFVAKHVNEEAQCSQGRSVTLEG